MRTALVLVLAALLFGAYAVWDQPNPQEQALAERTAAFIVARAGPFPLPRDGEKGPEGPPWAFRAARHGLVVFVTFGLSGADQRARVRAAAEQALRDVPGLEAVSLEWYDEPDRSGRARMQSRETVLPR
jgi:hypothetical protein